MGRSAINGQQLHLCMVLACLPPLPLHRVQGGKRATPCSAACPEAALREKNLPLHPEELGQAPGPPSYVSTLPVSTSTEVNVTN